MNQDQLGGIVRAIVPPLVTYLVAKGIIPAGSVDAIVSAAVTVAAAIWSFATNKSGKTIS